MRKPMRALEVLGRCKGKATPEGIKGERRQPLLNVMNTLREMGKVLREMVSDQAV